QTEKFMAVNESKGNTSYPILDFDVAVLGTADIKRIDEGTQLHYIITFKGPAAKVYTKAEFFANKKNSLIQKVIFCYAYKTAYMGENGQEAEDLMKMEITYSDVRFSTNKTFNTDKFLQLQNEGKFILRGEYQNYELIDQRLNK